jgi:hypothetical protein
MQYILWGFFKFLLFICAYSVQPGSSFESGMLIYASLIACWSGRWLCSRGLLGGANAIVVPRFIIWKASPGLGLLQMEVADFKKER